MREELTSIKYTQVAWKLRAPSDQASMEIMHACGLRLGFVRSSFNNKKEEKKTYDESRLEEFLIKRKTKRSEMNSC